jgi:hypothetical protein
MSLPAGGNVSVQDGDYSSAGYQYERGNAINYQRAGLNQFV